MSTTQPAVAVSPNAISKLGLVMQEITKLRSKQDWVGLLHLAQQTEKQAHDSICVPILFAEAYTELKNYETAQQIIQKGLLTDSKEPILRYWNIRSLLDPILLFDQMAQKQQLITILEECDTCLELIFGGQVTKVLLLPLPNSSTNFQWEEQSQSHLIREIPWRALPCLIRAAKATTLRLLGKFYDKAGLSSAASSLFELNRVSSDLDASATYKQQALESFQSLFDQLWNEVQNYNSTNSPTNNSSMLAVPQRKHTRTASTTAAVSSSNVVNSLFQSPFFSSLDTHTATIIQYALLEYPEVLLEQGKVDICIRLLRKIYNSSVKLQDEIKFKCLKLLSKALAHNVSSDSIYKHAMDPMQLQKQETQKLFAPSSAKEEATLILFILEQMTDHKNVLSPYLTRDQLISIYDDLCILLASQRHFHLLRRALEKGLSKFYEDVTFWFQLVLVLMNDKKYDRAYCIVLECIQMQPTETNYHLFAAKLCTEYLVPSEDTWKQGVNHAKQAIALQNPFYLHKAYRWLGLLYGKLSKGKGLSVTERQTYQQQALENLNHAYDLDSHDATLCYDLALQYAEVRDIIKAFGFVKRSISLNGAQVKAWCLLCLLFTSQKEYSTALATVKIAKNDFPNNTTLMLLHAKLVEVNEGEKKAEPLLRKAREYLVNNYLARLVVSSSDLLDGGKVNQEPNNTANTNGQASSGLHQMEEMNKENIAASQLQKNPSKLIRRCIKASQLLLWIADSYRRFSMLREAEETLKLAEDAYYLYHREQKQRENNLLQTDGSIKSGERKQSQAPTPILMSTSTLPSDFSKSSDLLYLEGALQQDQRNLLEALKAYEHAVILDTEHSEFTKHVFLNLGLYHLQQKKLIAAKGYLQNAVRRDPTFYQAWYHLGSIMKEVGDLEEASNCFFTALQFEKTAPLLPFEVLTL